jgi:hypothetical protein
MSVPYIGAGKSKENEKPYMQLAAGFDLAKQLKVKDSPSGAIYEFMGSDDFGPEWRNRVSFEVEEGRSRVPLLYESLYDIIVSADLPETQEIKNFGPGGFIFEEVVEGGEAKFGHITSSAAAVSQKQFAVGVEYTKKLIMFNQLWQLARIERYVGEAHNALLNHLHLYPIINQTYAAANQTAAVTSGASTTEDWFLTIESAIVNSQADTTNPRMGPYALLAHPAQSFMLQRAMNRVPQEGFQLDSSAAEFINQIIGYVGWTGTRGKKTVTYPGVTLGKGYLVNLAYKSEDFISLVKQPLESAQGNADVSRFILEQTVWDVWLGIFANPLRAVEEITFPS